jgi:hypothetical protein
MKLSLAVLLCACTSGLPSEEAPHIAKLHDRVAPLAPPPPASLSALQVWRWREAARELVHHAFGSYMRHAYPADELRPLSCRGRFSHERERGDLDDALLGASLTLIDSLDTLAVLGDVPAFRCAVSRLVATASFSGDVNVSVFEVNIRVVGGLVSAHLLSMDARLKLWQDGPACPGGDCSSACRTPGLPHIDFCPAEVACLPSYDGQLLAMAVEVARRLLPAFDTPTGLPYHRLNLGSGVFDPTSRVTCTAAAGTFLLEFGVLSRLTGDPVFEAVARRATFALWGKRSPLGLLGSAIDVVDGNWRTSHTGIGAGVDSYLEYLLKAGIGLDDEELMGMWDTSAAAVATHLDTPTARVHVEVAMGVGRTAPKSPVVLSPLQAWYPGAEVLAGSVVDARAHWRSIASLWAVHGAIPEGFDAASGSPLPWGKDSPLRPELAESTFHLYTATRDPALLAHAAAQLGTLTNSSRVPCGYASVADVLTGRQDDRMDSFFIAETGRYLFQVFDTALAQWFEGPPGAPSWVHPGMVDGAPALPRATAAAPLASSHSVERIASVYPSAHALTYARYDVDGSADASGLGDAVATLAIEQERALHTTEGHIFLVTHIPPATPLRPRAAAAAGPGRKRTGAMRNGTSTVLPAASLRTAMKGTCPRLASHVHAATPLNPAAFADAVVEAWALKLAVKSAARLMLLSMEPARASPLKAAREGTCPVAQLVGALDFADGSTSDAKALVDWEGLAMWAGTVVPANTSAMKGTLELAGKWASMSYPLKGSADLLPNGLRQHWANAVRPALEADIREAAPTIAPQIFSTPGVAPDQNLAQFQILPLASTLQVSWSGALSTWESSGWNGMSVFPPQKFVNILRERIGLHLLVDKITIRCDTSKGQCSATTGQTARHPAVRLGLRATDASSVLHFVGAAAQFGPLLTGRGLGPLRIWYDDGFDGCSPFNESSRALAQRSLPYLAVVLRGNCTFGMKARNAEVAEAAGILIVDLRPDVPVLDVSIEASGLLSVDFVMATDDNSSAISIPAVFATSHQISAEVLRSLSDDATICVTAAFNATALSPMSASPEDARFTRTSQGETLSIVAELFSGLADRERVTRPNLFGVAEVDCYRQGELATQLDR